MEKSARLCCVDGCGKKLRSDNRRGYCTIHKDRAQVKAVVLCCVDGCWRALHSDNRIGYCTQHRSRAPSERAFKTAWNKARAAERSAKDRADYSADPEKEKARVAAWRKVNREKALQATRRWARDNPDKAAVARATSGQRRRAKQAGLEGTYTHADREAVFDFYGWRCCHCAEDLLALPSRNRTLDHIVPVKHGGRNDTSNFRVLCRKCNSTKSGALPQGPL